MTIKLFNKSFFAELDGNAVKSNRRRSNSNLHQHSEDMVQRLFITLCPDSYVRPHKHTQPEKWECFIMISGEVAFLMFDDEGVCTERHILSGDGEVRGLEIPANVWHAVVPLEKPATFFEVKQGPYIALDDKGFARWSPPEGHTAVKGFLNKLKTLTRGNKVDFRAG